MRVGIAAVVAVVAWVYLVVGHGRFWWARATLPEGREPDEWPDVVAVVPARDEAGILPETLPTLLGQEYPGRFRVVLVDDGSGDGTAQVAARIGADVVRAGARPEGWAGKVWAMAEGVRAAGEPDFLLFTDADIAYAPGTVGRLVRAAVEERCDLVSQMARLNTSTRWERWLVPAFVYFFAQLYPFRRVARGGRTAAAAGGCMLVRREVLERAGGLERIRGALIDDVAFGRMIKRAGGRCRLDLSRDVVSRRPYPRPADLWDMVARSAYDQLRYSPVLLAGTVLGLVLLYLVPPVAGVGGLITGHRLAAGAGLAGWALMALTYVPMLRFYGLPVWRALALPLVAIAYTAMTVDSARRYRAGRGGAWKGRTVGKRSRAGTPDQAATGGDRDRLVLAGLLALTAGAGAMDALTFIALGNVFTANMTGNVVMFGIAAGGGLGAAAGRSAAALGGFVAGLWTGFRLERRGAGLVLAAELVLLAALCALWWATDVRGPGMVALAGAAMGLQSALAARISVPGVTTTYVTGTLTGLLGQLAELARPGMDTARRTAVVVALAAGATAMSLTLREARPVAPLLPLAAVAVVLAITVFRRTARKRR